MQIFLDRYKNSPLSATQGDTDTLPRLIIYIDHHCLLGRVYNHYYTQAELSTHMGLAFVPRERGAMYTVMTPSGPHPGSPRRWVFIKAHPVQHSYTIIRGGFSCATTASFFIFPKKVAAQVSAKFNNKLYELNVDSRCQIIHNGTPGEPMGILREHQF